MTADEIKAAIPGVEVRAGYTGGHLWLTFEMEHNGQHQSWSRRVPLDPSQEVINAFQDDLESWKRGVQE